MAVNNPTRPQRARSPRATLADVAAAAGVSAATVSNTFNNPERTSAETRSRVLAAAEELGYSPNPMARGLRRGRAGAIGVIVPERPTYAFSDPAGVALLDGLAEALGSNETGFLILSGDGTGGGPTPRAVASAVVDAFVGYGLPDDDPCVEAALRSGVPLICIEGPTMPDGWLVGIDDDAGVKGMTQHLLDLGHRDIAIVAMEVRPDGHGGMATPERLRHITFGPTRRRLDETLAALAVGGVNAEDVPIYEAAHNHPSVGREASMALLSREPRPTALICQSDQLALGALEAAVELGLAVPGDISITGFDDIDVANHTRPALTTVRQPLRGKGITAGELAAEALAGKPERRVILPVEVVLRGSTAPPVR